ncbi:Uncharacterised protein [Mycobacterium tuberculosis]|nr:Uncharacterised protein [Mycobacterium tuberculosis]
MVSASTCDVTIVNLLSAANASTMWSRFWLSTRTASGSVSSARPRLSLSRARIAETRFSPSNASMMS